MEAGAAVVELPDKVAGGLREPVVKAAAAEASVAEASVVEDRVVEDRAAEEATVTSQMRVRMDFSSPESRAGRSYQRGLMNQMGLGGGGRGGFGGGGGGGRPPGR